NGLRVFVVPNDEVGLFDARLFLRTGIAHDPVGKEGLGSLAFEMITHGAAGRTAVEQAQLLKPLGGEVSAYSSTDGAGIRVSGLSRNLEPLLDVWADVILRPDFPEEEWSVLQA